ncbi:MAG: hypothetical protein IJ174_04075, partial [Clostridia bacterium]|nr:hypothetical protein [Clostridia bacterium]
DLPEEDVLPEVRNTALTLSGKGGAVLTYATEPDSPAESLKSVAPGQSVRLVVNPEEGKLLKSGSLKATYVVMQDGKEVTQTIMVMPDEDYRYFLDIPENIVESKGVQVRAEFSDDGVEDRDPGHRGVQLAGAIAVNVTENNSKAVIDTDAVVTAGGDVMLAANAVTNVAALADGTAINGKQPSQPEEPEESYAIVRKDMRIVTEVPVEVGPRAGYTVSLRSEGVRTADGVESGTIELVDVIKDENGKITEIVVKPVSAPGFRMSSGCVAKTIGPDGTVHTYSMQNNGDGTWSRKTDPIDEGSSIAITAQFESDNHYFRTQNDEHGWIILYDNYVRTGEHPVVTLQPDPNYKVGVVTVTYITPNGTEEVQYTLDDPNGGNITLDIPALTEGSGRVYVSADFEKKTIKLIGGALGFADDELDLPDQFKPQCTVSEEYGAAGDTVKVTPDEDNAAKGYKVTGYKVTRIVNWKEETVLEGVGNTFTIPEGLEDAELTIRATLDLKEIELNETELEHGTLKPMTQRADRGETVDVHIDSDSGYRIKQGTLKAILASKDGTYREEIYMSRWTDFLYTFVMPEDVGDLSDLEITFEGEFEEGQAGEGTTTNLGAGLAVTYATSHNRADIKGTVSAAGDIIAQAFASNSASTESAAGYTSGTMGVGGAMSVQIASFDSKARIFDGANVSLDGALALEAGQAVNFKVDADASGSKRQAQGMGIGAGLAVAIDGADATAAIQKKAHIQPLKNKDGILSLTLRADQTVTDSVTSAAGAAGNDMTLIGAVSFDLTGTSAIASFPKIQETMFHVRKGMSITASNLATHVIKAEGATVGKGMAVGAAIGASVINDVARATLGQQVTAKRLTVSAVTESNVLNDTKATASGGRIPFRLRLKDSLLVMLAIPIMKLMAMSGNYYISKDQLDFILQFRLRILTTSGTMGITAAVGFNHQDSKSLAEVLDDIDVDVAGRMIVRAQNHTEAVVKGDGSTQDSTLGVGAGAGLNWVKLRNIASVGTGKIRAGSLEVSATTRDRTRDYTGLIDGLDTEEGVTDALQEVVEDYVRSLVTEMGLFDLVGGNVMDNMIDPMVNDLTREILEAAGLFGFIEDIDFEAVKKTLTEDVLPIAKIAAIPVAAVVGEFLEFEDDSYLERVRSAYVDTFNEEFIGSIDDDIRGMFGDILQGISLFLLDNAFTLLTSGSTTKSPIDSMKEDLNERAEQFTLKGLLNKAKKAHKEAWKAAKEEINECLSEIDSAFKGYADEELDALLNMADSSGYLADKIDVDDLVDVGSDLYEAYNNADADDASGGSTPLERVLNQEAKKILNVCQPEQNALENMVNNVTEPDYSKQIENDVNQFAEENNIILSDEQLAILRDPSDLRTDALRTTAGGHVIDTQAVSGAGSRSIGISGSAAYTNLNFVTRAVLADQSETKTVKQKNEDGEEEETKVTTVTPGKTVTVAGDLVIIATENRFVNNVASAALDSRGNASANHSAGAAANLDVGTDEDVQSVAENESVRMTVGFGGTAEIPESEMGSDRPKIRISLKTGFTLEADEKTGKIYADYTFSDQSGYESEGGRIEVKKDSKGYYVDTNDVKNVGDDAQIAIALNPVEVLHNVPTPSVTSPVDVEADAVTVGVKDREVVGNKLSARAGDIVYVTVQKASGRRVETIGYTYVDAQGRTRTVEINPSVTTSRDEAVFTQIKGDKNEFTYAFRMPDGELTDIDVTIV